MDVKSQDAVIRRFIVIDIDLPILWDTATRDLPKLIAKLEEIGVPGS
ncbi:MAG TPA: hypothetical protein VE685_03000 [Thermoanaerobaculia bacterium]|nr:hypothetical protein [Thermoanaerobaculia bacterium]